MKWKEFLKYEIFQFGSFELLMGSLLIGIAIVVGTILLLLVLKRMILRPHLFRDKIPDKRRSSIYILTKYLVWIISIVLVLQTLGVNLTALLIGSSALLIGLGLGLQNIFKDLVSGIFLLFEGAIQIGDIIEADGVLGRVVEINLRSSELVTRDDVKIIIPNSRFVTDKIVNWSHDGDQVRFEVSVGLAYGTDVEKAIIALQEVLNENKRVLNVPKSFVRFANFGDSSLEFQLIFWSRDTFGVNNLKSDLRRAVYIKLKEKGMEIPFPQRDIHIKGMEQISMSSIKD